MSEDDTKPAAPARTIEAPMTSFVRGGTISSGYEQGLAAKRADAEQRRAHQDKEHAIAAKDKSARLSTIADLGSHQNHPMVVLELKHAAGHPFREFLVCELFVPQGGDQSDLSLNMCCPFCAPIVGSGEANFKFSRKHRGFELDQRRAGEVWHNPDNPGEFYTLAGTIHTTEAITCPGVGCAWRFKIDNSIVFTLSPSNRR